MTVFHWRPFQEASSQQSLVQIRLIFLKCSLWYHVDNCYIFLLYPCQGRRKIKQERIQAMSFACSSISAACFRATSTRSWNPLKSWLRSGGVGGGVLKSPLCAFVVVSSLDASSWYVRELSVKLMAEARCRSSKVWPARAGWPKWKGDPFSAVPGVWHMTDGRAKTDAGGEGLQVLFGPGLPERQELSVSGRQFFVPMENSTAFPSAILVPLLDIVKWFGSFPSFLNMSGRSLRRALINQLQTWEHNSILVSFPTTCH